MLIEGLILVCVGFSSVPPGDYYAGQIICEIPCRYTASQKEEKITKMLGETLMLSLTYTKYLCRGVEQMYFYDEGYDRTSFVYKQVDLRASHPP